MNFNDRNEYNGQAGIVWCCVDDASLLTGARVGQVGCKDIYPDKD